MKNVLIIGCGLLGSSLLRRISKKRLAKKIFVYEKSKKNIIKIRKLKLPGVLVKKLDHTMGQNEIWDMNNSFGIPVASGMYIAHVDTDACQAVVKLAIIASEQRLDRY